MKKILLFLVCISITVHVQAYDFEVKNSDGVSYYYKFISKEDNTISICQNESSTTSTNGHRWTNYQGDIEIPSSVVYEGVEYTVKEIADYAFYVGKEISSVNIPNSIKKIGSYSFYDCIGLTSIAIPQSVISLGTNCFYGCSNVTTLTLSGAQIGSNTFNTRNLKKITVLSERPPVCASVFSDVYSTATLYVPSAAYNAYISISPWSNFKNIVRIDYDSSNKCSAPEITFAEKTLAFSCATPRSQIHYSYYLGNMGTAEPDSDLVTLTDKSNSIIVIAYATAEGYEQSATVIKSFPFDAKDYDINDDNKINIADVTTLVDIILNQDN